MNYLTIENILSGYSPLDLSEGMKADGGGGDRSTTDQRRQQLTVFTASAFSSLQPPTPPQSSGRGRKRSCPMKTELTVAGGFNGELQGLPPAALKQKIPRPPNAFMLFANDWRRKLASQFPKESNKDISIRLGGMWKNMEKDEKEKYFQFAREVDAAHKKKYPDYVYNPKEARMRKALREQSRGERQGGGTGGSGQHRGGGGPAPWGKHRQIMNQRQPIMVGEQPLHHPHQLHHPHLHPHHNQSSAQRGADDVTAISCKLDASGAGGAGGGMIQNFNDYLSDLSYPVNQPGNEFIVPDLDQSWYSYIQGPVQNATYLMRAPPDKVISSSSSAEWGTHFAADNASFIHTSSQNGTGNGNEGFLGSASTIGSRDQQQLVNGSTGGHQTPTHHIGSPITEKSITIHDQTNTHEIKDSVLDDGKSLLELSQIKVEGQNGIDGSIGKDGLRLPGFQQAFGSTEIGRFSQHEGFFEASIPQPEAQPEPKVSITPQNTTGKRTRNPRGSRKSKTNRSSSETPEKTNWQQEVPLPMKKEPWSEMNGGGVVPPMGHNLGLGMSTPMNNPIGMNNPVRNNCYMYPPMDEQQSYGQQWSHHPSSHLSMPPPMMQDPNGYYQHQHHNQHHSHQYCQQPYYSNQPDMPMTSPGRGFHPDYGEPFYSPYPPPQNWRNHPYYNQHHFPPHHQNIPPPYINQQYNDISPYRHCSSGTAGYQNHNRTWAMNRDYKLHNYSSGIV